MAKWDVKPVKPPATGLAVGLNRGFVTTRRPLRPRPSNRKGKLGSRVKMIREVIREVVGFAPYEKRMIELLKIGSASTQKRALKLAKKRLGTHKRGKQNRELRNRMAVMEISCHDFGDFVQTASAGDDRIELVPPTYNQGASFPEKPSHAGGGRLGWMSSVA